MKTYEEKRTILCDIVELYLDTRNQSYINVNDGVLRSTDIDSKNFLLLMALTFPNDGSNDFAMDIEVDDETRKNFVDIEYKKVISSKKDLITKGKMVLDDAKSYYNRKYGNISYEQINEIARKLGEMGFHI